MCFRCVCKSAFRMKKTSIQCFLSPKALWNALTNQRTRHIELVRWFFVSIIMVECSINLYQPVAISVLFLFYLWNRINFNCLEWHQFTIMASAMQWCRPWAVCKVKYPGLVQVSIFCSFFFSSLDACVVYFTVWCQERTEDIIWGQISLCGVLKVLLYLFFLFTM
jgi:hypothetical protein